ncbi:MAG: hypothetical protein RBS96_06305 [Dehalococcoidales bacterium]|jgi:hypothetical protein|nr:hypothetical protein [Dehalococcoidales bacterium]
MGDKDRTKLSRIKANLPIDIAQPVFPVDENGYGLGTVDPLIVEDENSDDILTAVEKLAEDNFEDDLTAVETWLELPENIKAVSFILDCSDNTEASVEYTHDRSASPAVAIESEIGTLSNDKESGYLAGAVGQIRMNNVISNEVVAVPTVTKITFATAVPTTGDTIVFGDETYEFTTDSETGLTDPANIRIDMDALSITDEITAAQGFKTVFNENTAYDVAGTGDAAVITLTASANFEDYNDLATTTSITATATATYEDATFGGGTGDSTTGVDAVAATLPKLWIIGIK